MLLCMIRQFLKLFIFSTVCSLKNILKNMQQMLFQRQEFKNSTFSKIPQIQNFFIDIPEPPQKLRICTWLTMWVSALLQFYPTIQYFLSDAMV